MGWGRSPTWNIVALACVACAGADPNGLAGAGARGSHDEPNEPVAPRAGAPSGGSAGIDADAGSDARDGDAAAPRDAGPEHDAGADTGAAANAFTGAPAYVATLGPSARRSQHGFAGNTPTTSPAGRPCMSCHGPAGRATEFAFAGTVYANAAGTAPAARVEVRVRDVTGKTLSAYTDADGNFYFPLNPSGDLVFPVLTGARIGASTELMAGSIANGNCNGCHTGGGGTARIHVP
jgi:hypothetical protein